MVQPAPSATEIIDYPNPIDMVDYPSSDGLPMTESDFQLRYILYAVAVLREHFRDRNDVYVSGNLFIYYEEGKPKYSGGTRCLCGDWRRQTRSLLVLPLARTQGA